MNLLFGQWDQLAGSITLLSGASAGSETATQDQIRLSGANMRVGKMKDRVADMFRDIYQKIAWYIVNDPKLDISVPREIESGIVVNYPLRPDEVSGTYDVWDYDINPYSAQEMTPERRQAILDQRFGQALQMLPIAQQDGIVPDVREYLRLTAKYTGMPELLNLFKVMQGEPIGGEAQPIEILADKKDGRRTQQGPVSQIQQAAAVFKAA